jgi:hypothetical protein
MFLAPASSITSAVAQKHFTGGGLNPLVNNAKNTAALVAGVINALPEFTATASGDGSTVIPVTAPTLFTSGVDPEPVVSGCDYRILTIKQKVVIEDGDDATFGAKADSAVTDSTATGTFMSFVKGILATIKSVITSNKVQVDVTTITAGSNIIGKVGIDQTTDGTTNLVVVKQSTHDNLNLNANLQQNNTDVASGNPVYTQIEDGKAVTIGTKADAPATTGTTDAWSLIAMLKGIYNKLGAVVLAAGTAFIGRSGAVAFKAISNFTRPADTAIYAADDAISNVASSAIAVTFQDAGDTVTLNGHGLRNGTVVSFATVVTTTGISTSTNYFVVGSSTNTFQVAASYGGAALPLTTDGSGTMNPCTLCYDLSADGAVAGQQYEIRNARVISSVKGTVLDIGVNLWIFNTVFSGTLDNAALSIDDTTSQTGGIVIPCTNGYRTAVNHRAVSDCGGWMGKLAAADTKLYFVLQANTAYTPQSGEVLYVVFEGVLL